MLPEHAKLISVDDHIVEPAHVFVDHIEPKYRDQAPVVIERDGREGWLYEDRFTPLSFQGNPYTRNFRELEQGHGDDLFARRYADMIPAAYDVDARVAAMDEDGVWAALQFPTYTRFGGTMFLQAEDKDLALAVLRAWNDWLLDEWWAAHPARTVPQTLVPLWDVHLAVAEMERCKAKGSRAALFLENPAPLGLPSYASGYWRPLFEASHNLEMPLSMHIGTSSGLPSPSPEASKSVGVAVCGINSMIAVADIIYSGMLNGLPNCKLALSEGGAGWAPYVVERCDYTWLRSRRDGLMNDVLPSEQFAQHFWVCFIADDYAIKNRHEIGITKLMWECDFPHNDCNYPNSRKVLADSLIDVPDDEALMIAETNARTLYDFWD